MNGTDDNQYPLYDGDSIFESVYLKFIPTY